MKFSQKGSSVMPSLTLCIDAKAKKMNSEGLDVVGFGAGEPDFNTPEFILSAAKEALDKGNTKYTPVSGILGLKEAICRKFKRDNDLAYKPHQIIVSNGAKHSLYNIFQAILNPNDEVLIPAPYWLSYPEMVRMADGIPIIMNSEEKYEFKITPEDIKKAITPNTKAIIINSPNNPTGSVYCKAELASIAELAVANNLFVISDEIYEHMIYDGTKHVSIASFGQDIKELTITVNGMSKSFAMPGWRIGYAAGSEDIVDIMANIQSHSTSNPNSIAQYAAMAGLNGTYDAVYAMVKEFSDRRNYMTSRIRTIPDISCTTPKGAFYVMMNIHKIIGKNYKGRKINDSMTFADILLDAQNVALVPGIVFGAEGFVRLSYATSSNNIAKGLDRIEAFIKQLEF